VKSLDSGVINARGQIKVTDTFQLESHPNIYAIGDVIDWSEQKQAAKAVKHADVAAANIISQVNGGSATKKYTGQPELIIITNGKVSGCCFGCLF
jgi:NADH dehydrogenase FAD-containing subunit